LTEEGLASIRLLLVLLRQRSDEHRRDYLRGPTHGVLGSSGPRCGDRLEVRLNTSTQIPRLSIRATYLVVRLLARLLLVLLHLGELNLHVSVAVGLVNIRGINP
jgi:hypothetical protein